MTDDQPITLQNLNDCLPGYTEATAQLAVLAKVQVPVARAASAVDATRDDVLQTLNENGDVAAMLLPAAAAASEEIAAVAVARAALVEARQSLEGQRDQALRNGTDGLCTALNAALCEVVAQVRDLAPLDELASDAAAIASDRAADITRLRRLASDYARIRAEQRRVYERAGIEVEVPAVTLLEDLAEVFPRWTEWQRGSTAPPWPTSSDVYSSRRDVLRDGSSLEFLTWAVQLDAGLWVPDRSELLRAAAELDSTRVADDDARRAGLGAPALTTARIR